MGRVRAAVRSVFGRVYFQDWKEVPFDNTYDWLGYAFQELMKDPLCARRPMYVWGVLQGTALARVLGVSRVSALEFGVAGGGGLLSLEHIADEVGARIGIEIEVVGFDTATGMPRPEDYRDQPNMWFEGQLPMNQERVKSLIRRASLRLGPVRTTVPAFLEDDCAPIAFISFDLDLYSSTRDALTVFLASHERLLPRVFCYFDDIIGHTYNDFAGERLALSEFNDGNRMRKLSPAYGIRHFVPRRFLHDAYWDSFYYAHLFDHPLYNRPDSFNKAVYMDEHGGVAWKRIDSGPRRDGVEDAGPPPAAPG